MIVYNFIYTTLNFVKKEGNEIKKKYMINNGLEILMM